MDTRFNFRYVDDVFMTVNKEDIDSTLETINRWHSNLKFTSELKNDAGEINFLDLTIMRNAESNIDTKWFQKPTNYI